MKSLRSILAFSLFWVAGVVHAQQPESVAKVVAKARAQVGSEAALNALTSIRYAGTLETAAADGKTVRLQIELIFQKPAQQRVVITSQRKVETTALDDYEAWQRQQDPQAPGNWIVTILPIEQIYSLRANTWENLSFYRGIETHGGRLEDRGLAQADGVQCRKLAYIYRDNMYFIRYFEVDTGRLVLTETESGSKIRQVGEMTVNGLRFPKQLVTTNTAPDGKEHTVTISFDQITTNEVFPASDFAMPPPAAR